jgi:hypothetical protein
MRLLSLLVSVIVLGAVGEDACRAGEPENLFKKVAVGDWAAYKCSYNGVVGDGTRKLTVTAKDDKEVTLSDGSNKKVGNVPLNTDMKIDLTKPYDPKALLYWGLPRFEPATEKTVEGDKETIKVGKTKYECKVLTITRTYKDPKRDGDTTFEFKLWISPDAPLGGIVKQEMKVADTGRLKEQASMTLEDSGKAD